MAKSKKPAKPAKPAKTPAKKAKPAKPKPKPAASKPKPKPTGKTTGKAKTGTKGTKTAKASGSGKPKKPVKPTKPTTTSMVNFVAAGLTPVTTAAIGPVNKPVAHPQITDPTSGSPVTAGADLTVKMTTDQTGFRYILTLSDVTPRPLPPAPPIPVPAPVDFNIAAPGASPFSHTIPGANFVAGHSYRLRLWVDPRDGLTPPQQDATISLTA